MWGYPVTRRQWRATLTHLILGISAFLETSAFAQAFLPEAPQPQKSAQINVNWFYGSYVPKEVPLQPLDSDRRLDLYLRRTFTAKGIYIKTTLFALADQAQNQNPRWGKGFDGLAKRLGTRQAEFIMQNSLVSLGDGLLGWEPRYDRCRCAGFWPRTRHAFVRSFVTYDRTEKKLRPQLLPYLGAFAGSTIATTWEPDKPQWQIKGYQAVITQVPVGIGTDWMAEVAVEMGRVLHGHKIH